MSDDIIGFYLGQNANYDGTWFDDVLDWDNFELERDHNYIQYLFPLMERSKCQPHSPVLHESDVDYWLDDDRMRKLMIKAFQTMLRFYGLKMDGMVLRVVKADDYKQRAAKWQTKDNHNFLRITRILKSMTLLGLKRHAHMFLDCLLELVKENPDGFNKVSVEFWKEAVK